MNKKKLLTILLTMVTLSTFAQGTATTKQDFDWNPVMDAIIWHESKGVATARHGQFVGVLQIHPVLVNGVNKILAARGDSTRFTLNDRLSPEKSKQMFVIIQQHYNPECDVDKAIRIWAAGPGYTIRGTQRAVNEIRAIMKKQELQRRK